MFVRVSLAAIAASMLFTTVANADHRWRKPRYYFDPLEIITSTIDPVYEDEAWIDDEFADEPTLKDMRERRKRWARENDEAWWLEDEFDDAPVAKPVKKKPASVEKPKKPTEKAATAPKPKLKPAATAATVTPKAKLPVVQKVQSASLTPKLPVAAPKAETPKSKPAATPKLASKTVGCTGGAAIVTGLGFAGVRPRVCTGDTFAYMATKSDGTYAIKLKAATGEVVDVKKLP